MSDRDNPRLTAYALGALDDAERRDVETSLASDPEAAAEVASLRETAERARAALATEQGAAFSAERRDGVVAAAQASKPSRRLFRAALVAVPIAASLVGVVLLLGHSREERSLARRDLSQRTPAHSEGNWVNLDDVTNGLEDRSSVKQRDRGSSMASEVRVDGVAVEAPRRLAVPQSGGGGGHGMPGVDWASGPDKVILADAPEVVGGVLRGPGGAVSPGLRAPSDEPSTEAYDPFVEEGYKRPAQDPLSTFSIDVDTASYANVRRFLNEGRLPPPGAVRVEELVNYFPYAYDAPRGAVPFAVHVEVAQCPWALEHRLVRIGIKGREIDLREKPPSNLVFLLDVSGSMNHPNRLPLVRESMKLLVENLQAADRVSIVVYAGASGLVLPPTGGDRKAEIVAAIDSLQPGGSTNGAAGIALAYETAQAAFLKGGNNRVVLCTDGDFNVGVTSQDELVRLIEAKAKSGVFLTVLGYGMGNYKDATLEKLADKGNGNYGYVDSLREARKVLVEEATGTLFAIAKDVKVQVEFNPAQVAAYRLVGYDNRRLAAQDFNDDTKDAGEIGAGHTVTAFYEVVPAGRAVPGAGAVDPLKYQDPPPPAAPAAGSPEMLTLKMRWKAPDSDTSEKIEQPLVDAGLPYDRASGEYKFAAAVAAFALILRDSAWKGTASFEGVTELASEALGSDPGGYRREFLELVAKARLLVR